jgi:periplasmic protein TonB
MIITDLVLGFNSHTNFSLRFVKLKTNHMNKYAGVSMNDIIFEGRNKDYGAYMLRETNERRAALSLAIALSTCLLLIFISQASMTIRPADPPLREVYVSQTENPLGNLPQTPQEEVPPPVIPEEIPEAGAEIDFVEMNVVEDNKAASNPQATQSELNDLSHQIGTENRQSDLLNLPSIIEPHLPKGTSGPALGSEENKEDKGEEKVFNTWELQERAEFPGGTQAMYAFISKHMTYPEIALENTIEGTVMVEFTIGTDGSVANIKVLKDIGGGCGKEAERVLRMMPKWKPGKQMDMPVKSKFQAPIKFKIPK